MKCIGIFREVLHSPHRERDDYEILRLTGQVLAKEGLEVETFEPEEFLKKWVTNSHYFSSPALIFMMCEQQKILEKIRQLETAGIQVVNSTQSIYNTYRHHLIPLWKKDKISQPLTELVSTALLVKDFKAITYPLWVKRGDVHNTAQGDVVLVQSADALDIALQGLSKRGIQQAALQKHIEGDLVKFYGIGISPQLTWFQWFYHKGQKLREIPFSEAELKKNVECAAKSIGVEVFGGDAVIGLDGKIDLIDMNAWPSFALFRAEASQKIASYLIEKMKECSLFLFSSERAYE